MNFNKFQVCWRRNKTQSVQTQPKRGRNEQQEKQDDTESVIKTSEQIYCLHRASFCPASHLALDQSRFGQIIHQLLKPNSNVSVRLHRFLSFFPCRDLSYITPAMCVWKHLSMSVKPGSFRWETQYSWEHRPIGIINCKFIYSNQPIQQKVKICSSLTFGEARAIMLICKWPLWIK